MHDRAAVKIVFEFGGGKFLEAVKPGCNHQNTNLPCIAVSGLTQTVYRDTKWKLEDVMANCE